ncbi:MAG: outer membrane beta-barrel protein, partial [Flavobacteriales bacterium]|nr:outer membrane beta-barrel protein [Flavobacteriales bacterium]
SKYEEYHYKDITKESPILPTTYSTSEFTGRNPDNWTQLTVNYSRDYDTLGTRLFTGADAGTFNDDYYNKFIETTNGISNTVNNTEKIDYQFMNYQLDYSKYFTEDKYFETGAKTTLGHSNFSSNISSSLNNLDTLSNEVIYDESITSVYFLFGNKIKESYYEIGIRGEYARTKNNAGLSTSMPNIFPSGTFFLRESVALSYSTSIWRPDYSSTSSSTSFTGGDVFSSGNSSLMPSYNHSLDLSFFDEVVSLSYNRTNNAQVDNYSASNDSVNYFYSGVFNIDYFDSYWLNITIPVELDKLTSYTWIGTYLMRGKDINGFTGDPSVGFMIDSETELELNKRWSLSTNIFYQSKMKLGLAEIKEQFVTSAGVFYNTKNNKLRISAQIWDAFYGERYQQKIFTNEVTSNESGNPDTRYIEFSLRFKFGKLEQPSYDTESIQGQGDKGGSGGGAF